MPSTDKRFDNRSKDRFMKDIAFGTALERYFFNRFIQSCNGKDHIDIFKYQDNGVDNDGKFVESGTNTAGADYKVDMCYGLFECDNVPLEVKWVPTHGKLTLKEADLRSYEREGAAILFIYTTKRVDLRKPKDYDLDKHIEKIENYNDILRWGIMLPFQVDQLLRQSREQGKIKPISYMGNKPGIILPQSEFSDWFVEETL